MPQQEAATTSRTCELCVSWTAPQQEATTTRRACELCELDGVVDDGGELGAGEEEPRIEEVE